MSRTSAVYGIWNQEDEYGPDLVGVHLTRELAEAELTRLNAPHVASQRRHGRTVLANWPYMIIEHLVAS